MEREACAAPPAYWEVYKLVSRALARSVAACLPLNSLQSATEVAVKVRVQREPHVQTAVAGEVSVHLNYMQAHAPYFTTKAMRAHSGRHRTLYQWLC